MADLGRARLILADCLEALRTMPDACVDSIVTDPPYGLTTGKKGGTGAASVNLESPYGRSRIGTGNGTGGFMGLAWDADVPPAELWAECLRVLKPGGHLLAFAGTRTQHRMACRIEDGGFEIRDMIAWVYGSGFPKSLDVSKALDAAAGATREVLGVAGKSGSVRNSMAGDFAGGEYMATAPATAAAAEWAGWGTALKPALEPITVARKPLIGTVAENVLAHGTGALNIDGARVPAEAGGRPLREVAALREGVQYEGNALCGRVDGSLASSKAVGSTDVGRWPANLIHDGSDEVLAAFPQAPGQMANVSATAPNPRTSNVWGPMGRGSEPFADSDNEGVVGFKMKPGARRLDTGSAARFFYCAKASRSDREAENTHPTVKPTDLMRYLCRLVTPPGGLVLDPFMGSGSTGKAAALEGFQFVGIEREAAYHAIAMARVGRALFPHWI